MPAPVFKSSRQTTVNVDLVTTPRTTDRTVEVENQLIGVHGRIISCAVIAAVGTPIRGQSFVAVSVARGGTADIDEWYKLTKGYLGSETGPGGFGSLPVAPNDQLILRSATSVTLSVIVRLVIELDDIHGSISWRGQFEDSLSGPGAILAVTGSNPDAGAEISETVPTDARWRLISLQVICLVGAALINPRFVIDDGATEVLRTHIGGLTAAASEIITWAGRLNKRDETGNHLNVELGPDFPYLPGGWRIRTEAISADDDYGAPEMWVEEWIDFEE